MPGVAERLRLALVVLAPVLAGCAGEPVRPTVEPPAVVVSPTPVRIEAAAVCWMSFSPSNEHLVEEMDALGGLAAALREAGLFIRVNGLVVDLESLCMASFDVISIDEGASTSGEPEHRVRCALEVGVRGEPPAARYEVLARGPRGSSRELIDLAARALVTHFAADGAAHARIRAELSDSPAADLEPLLVVEETFAPRARWRTRRLIAWKSEALAAHVSEARTSELRALVGRMEACMVDLSHQGEVWKDRAQAIVARGGDSVAERELALAHLERVEALRPILAAVKEELDARGR